MLSFVIGLSFEQSSLLLFLFIGTTRPTLSSSEQKQSLTSSDNGADSVSLYFLTKRTDIQSIPFADLEFKLFMAFIISKGSQ